MNKDLNCIAIRNVCDEDMPAIQAIYAFQVLHGVSSWENEPPSLKEMVKRKEAINQSGFPYRVAVRGNEVLGYAYASAYRNRPAYRYTVENSIYLADSVQRTGLGQRLLKDLIVACTALGFRQMIAVVGDSGNTMSIDFHKKMGFEQVGLIKSIGYKFNGWLDSVVLQLTLGEGDASPPKGAAQAIANAPSKEA